MSAHGGHLAEANDDGSTDLRMPRCAGRAQRDEEGAEGAKGGKAYTSDGTPIRPLPCYSIAAISQPGVTRALARHKSDASPGDWCAVRGISWLSMAAANLN